MARQNVLKCALALFVSIYLSPAVFAGDVELSLSEAIHKTLSQNPELARFVVKGKQLNYERSTVALRPELNMQLEVENFAGSGEFSGFDAAETTLALSSVIELGDKRDHRVNVHNAKIGLFQTENEIRSIDVLSELTMTFISGLTIQEKMVIAQDSVSLMEEITAIVQRRVDRGISPEINLIQAKADLATEKLKLASLEQKYDVVRYLLAAYWGELNPGFSQLEGELFVFSEAMPFDELFERVKDSPAMLRYADLARLDQAEIQFVKASSRSNVEWQVGIRQFNENNDTALVAGFSVPLFTKRRNNASFEQARLNARLTDIDREQALILLHQRLYQAYSQRQVSINAVHELKESILPDLEKSVALTQSGYESGRYRYQDLVQAREKLLQIRWDKAEQASQVLLNQSIIEKLTSTPLSHSHE